MKLEGLALSLCALAAACGGGGGGGGDDVDAAPARDATVDSAITVDGPTAVDGALAVDGAITVDAAVDAVPGVATEITVLDPFWYGEPSPGLTVVFSEDARTQSAVTDAAGRAVAGLNGPATVTVIRAASLPGFSVVSVYGVQPGEHIVFGPPDISGEVRATMEIEVPPFDGAGGPYTYFVYSSCTSRRDRSRIGTRQTVTIDRPCEGDRFDIHVEAVADTRVEATLTVTGQTIVDGGLLALDGEWALPVQLEIRYTDLPDGLAVIPGITPYFRGLRVTAQEIGIPPCEEAVPTCTYRPSVSPAADHFAAEARVWGAEDDGAFQVQHAVFASSQGAPYTAPIRLLPWISDLAVDRATSRVSWRASAGDPADAVAVVLGFDEMVWVLLAPPDVQELRVPDLSAIAGLSGADVDNASLMLIDRDDVDGYDAYRPAAEPLTWTAGSGPIGSRISNSPLVRAR